MPEEDEKKTEGQEGQDDFDAIEEIKKLKSESVPKKDYDKVVAERNRALKALTEGVPYGNEEKAKQPAREELEKKATSIRSELYGRQFSGTDLDYVSKTLELRKTEMALGMPDPFLGISKKVTSDDVERSNEIAETLQKCVDDADGDDVIFRNNVRRVTVD